MIPEIWLAVGALVGAGIAFGILARSYCAPSAMDLSELDALRGKAGDDCGVAGSNDPAGVSRPSEADTGPIQAPRWKQYPAGFGCGECD